MGENNIQDAIKRETAAIFNDFVYGIKKYFKVEHPKKGKILFNLFPFQEDTINRIRTHRFVVIGKSRQMGISTLMAAYALLMMIFNPNYKVLVIATKQTVAANLVRKVKIMYLGLPSWLRGAKGLVVDNATGLELANGSVIKAESSSGASGRSEAISLLIIDEAAFIDNFEEIWTASQMTLATGGDAVILSTPNGVGNLFHKIFTRAEAGKTEDGFDESTMFHAIRLPWYLHPERDQAWRDQQDILLGKRSAAQECDVDFLASGATVVEPEILQWYEKNMVKEPLQKRGEHSSLWIWDFPKSGKTYMVSADVATGDGSDYSAFHVLEVDTLEQVAEFEAKIGMLEYARILVSIAMEYNNALLIIENTGIGMTVVQQVINLNYNNLHYSYKSDSYIDPNIHIAKNIDLKDKKDKTPGFTNSHSIRPILVSKVETYMRERIPIIYSKRTIESLRTFIWRNSRGEAAKGYNDDLVMSLSFGLFLRDTAIKLKQIGIEMTKKSLDNIHKTVYVPKMTNNNPWEHKNSRGHIESLTWLL